MKANISALTALALILALGIACKPAQKAAKTDPQVASDVQAKIASDPAITSRQIEVQASGGTVTLSGLVNSGAEKVAASNNAAAIDGVKQVLNNLQVEPGADLKSGKQPPQAEPPVPVVSAKPARPTSQSASRKSSAVHKISSADPAPESQNQVPQALPAHPEPSQQASAAPAPVPRPSAPTPAKVTIEGGTPLSVRLIDGLDSEVNQDGDVFRATLNAPIMVEDRVAVPAGADIEGRVVAVHSAGKFAGKSVLTIELTSLSYNGLNYPLSTSQWSKEGSSRGKNTAEKVGGGAALGAIIGGIAGGGKGAAIGSVVGGGAGTGVQAATRGQQIKLRSEAVLSFTLQRPLTVTAASELRNNANRQPLN